MILYLLVAGDLQTRYEGDAHAAFMFKEAAWRDQPPEVTEFIRNCLVREPKKRMSVEQLRKQRLLKKYASPAAKTSALDGTDLSMPKIKSNSLDIGDKLNLTDSSTDCKLAQYINVVHQIVHRFATRNREKLRAVREIKHAPLQNSASS